MPRLSAEAERERLVERLLVAFRAQPQRTLGSLSAPELLAMIEPKPNDKGGRSIGDGRKYPETDDRYLYVMAFRQRAGIPPEQTLLELLDLDRPTEADGTNKDYARILSYYQNHPELYRDVGLVLHWNEETERLSVTPVTAADLADIPEPIFDVDELFKKRP